MQVFTSLEDDYLLINRLSASEGLSRLFSIDAELLHEEDSEGYDPTVVDPQSLIGQGITIKIEQADGTGRYFNGICNRFSQGTRHARFSFYNISVVPHVWILTQSSQSRIFQQKTVPDILNLVFKGFEVKYEFQRTYQKRNYCVQYRESDFDFAARLMEEEGIFYFFEHSAGVHKMIVADTPQSHRDCPTKSTIPYFHKVDNDDLVTAIHSWRKEYQLQAGKVTFWAHNFQKPGSPLDAEQPSRFDIGGNKQIEVYEYPGGYARKYDGIDRTGSPSESELEHIYTDKTSTAEIAMQALDVQHQISVGTSDCSAITAGHRFTMSEHPNGAHNRQYVLTNVQHTAFQSPSYVSDEAPEVAYQNTFQTIDHGAGATPFRPRRSTAKPTVQGSQTATVVGPSGEEIFTDKYGRVKVQFNWDRDGQRDSDSACWLRVAQPWAGNKWGSMFIPRIGMEVLVHFLEGDPDQPIITGTVYNPGNMPPYTLPDEKTKSTLKSYSTPGGGGFNELRFEDKKGEEQVFIHGQKDMDIRVKSDRRELIGNDRHLIVKRDKREKIDRDVHGIIERDLIEHIKRDEHRTIDGKIAHETSKSYSHKIGTSSTIEIGANGSVDATGNYTVAANQIVLEAQTGITLKVGGNFITISSAGVQISGTMVMINSGGAALPGSMGSIAAPLKPEEAEIADNADPGSKSPTYKNQRRNMPEYKKPSFKQPSHNPKDPKNKDKKSWIELELKDELGNPVVGERYRVTLPDGSTISEGTTDEDGLAKVSNIDPGSCKITFPRLDDTAWDPS